jgi:selenocysteine lyase/cysteine desulfurase
LETGTLNHEGIVGAGAAVDFLASLASSGASRRERLDLVSQGLQSRGAELLGQLWEGLRGIRGVELYGVPPGARRTPTLSFTLAGQDSGAIAVALAERGVFVSSGDFYAATVARVLGHEHDGFVRAGCAAYTTAEEVERLIDGVRRLA